MGPSWAGHKEHGRLCMVWARSPAWECQKAASSPTGLILLCAQTHVRLTVVSGERDPLLVKKAACCSPAVLLPACCSSRCTETVVSMAVDRAAPAGSTAGCLFPLFLPSVGRYLELFCLRADILQDCGNGNLCALTALVFTLQTVSSFFPADPMPALTAGRVLLEPRCGWLGLPALLGATANTSATATASALGSAEAVHSAERPVLVSYGAVNRITSR